MSIGKFANRRISVKRLVTGEHKMAGKLSGMTSLYGRTENARCGARKLGRWDNAWVFYDNPAYQLKQADSSTRGNSSSVTHL